MQNNNEDMLKVDDAVHLLYSHVPCARQYLLLHFNLLESVEHKHFFDKDVEIFHNVKRNKGLDLLDHVHNISRERNCE